LPDACARHLEGRFRLLDLLENLAVFDGGDALAASDPVAHLDDDTFEAPGGFGHNGDGLLAHEISDDRKRLRHVGAARRRQFNCHRRPRHRAAAKAAGRLPPGGRVPTGGFCRRP
jgi:hypothetical protein